MRDLRRENEAWRRANPWTLENVAVIGQSCGRYSTREEAIAASSGEIVEVNEAQKRVSFRGAVYC